MKNAEAKASEEQTAGPPQTWPATVEAMLEPIYRFVRARVPSDAVDDLVQETFVAASRGIDRFDGRCPVWNWLTAIARNKIAEHYRRNGSRGVLAEAAQSLNSDQTQVQQALLSEYPLPDEICARREFQALARAALSALSPDERECLIGRYYEDLSLDDLGRRLGISSAAANTRLHRARKELRRMFTTLLNDMRDHPEVIP